MIEFLANHPALFLALACGFSPPGLVWAGALVWLSRRFEFRTPLVLRTGRPDLEV